MKYVPEMMAALSEANVAGLISLRIHPNDVNGVVNRIHKNC